MADGDSQAFAAQLGLVMKALAMSRGQLAAELAVDKSLVSRWLSGATVPGNHNLTRLTAHVAKRVPGWSMFDWDRDMDELAERLGIDGGAPTAIAEAASLPDFASLPAFRPSAHETAARGPRYCGLWRSWIPLLANAHDFHCEHTILWLEGGWLKGRALGFSYDWPLIGYIAHGQLVLILSDTDDFVIRQFSRADGPIVDQVDGLLLSASPLPHQAPSACRLIMERLLPVAASQAEIDAVLERDAKDRCRLGGDDLPEGMARALSPDFGPGTVAGGGERVLRTDATMGLVKTRWS